jgi:hypothetical protein
MRKRRQLGCDVGLVCVVLISGILASFSLACASQNSFVQSQAAKDLQCPAGPIVVEEYPVDQGDHPYLATGCGRKIHYRCNGFGTRSICTEDTVLRNRDRKIEQAQARAAQEQARADDPTSACQIGGIDPISGTGSADIRGGAACLAGCEANLNSCMAASAPMSPERAACIDQRRTCGAGCVQMANSYTGRTIPCDDACKQGVRGCEGICACSLRAKRKR